MPHPRLLGQILTDAEINEWHAHLTLSNEEAEKAAKRAGRRRR